MTHPLAGVMDARGFLPAHPCRTCGTELQGQNTGYPAELYAGTYTGECYKCQNAPVRLLKEYVDGAKKWSYAPHCPSWRRAREEYTGYSDCPACKGTGRLYVARADGQGGSYYRYCSGCLTRFWRMPARAALQSINTRGYRVYQLAWNARCKRKPYKADEVKREELRATLLARRARTDVRLERMRASLESRGIL